MARVDFPESRLPGLPVVFDGSGAIASVEARISEIA